VRAKVIKMKSLPRLLVAGIALAILLMPLAILADQLPLPLEKKVPAGVTTVDYMGQTLKFTTAVPLVVKFEALSDYQIRLTVRTYSGTSGGAQGSSAGSMNIFWEDWSNDVYDGPPPSEPWEGILNTESGFTEK
jgi:hypothetical protein